MSGKNRANREGSLYQRKDKRWVGQVSLAHGGRKYVYGKTREEASRKLTVAMSADLDGKPQVAERLTFGRYCQEWLERKRLTVKRSSVVIYEHELRINLAPILGRVILAKLTTREVYRLHSELARMGKSQRLIRSCHRLLSSILRSAERDSLILRNPAVLVETPRVSEMPLDIPSPQQIRSFLAASKDDFHYPVFHVAVATGLRQGEMLALEWKHCNIDSDDPSLRVKHTLQRLTKGRFEMTAPKTKQSFRTIWLTPDLAAFLRKHRAEQDARALELGEAWGCEWSLVFGDPVGRPILATSQLRRAFRASARQAGIPDKVWGSTTCATSRPLRRFHGVFRRQ